MNKKYQILLIFYFVLSFNMLAQDNNLTERAKNIVASRNEVVVRFQKNIYPIDELTRIISIDKIEKDSIQAYVFKNKLDTFLSLNIKFSIVEPVQLKSLQSAGSIWQWNKYPTYNEYISMMDSFARAYPSLCRIVEAGKSKENRSILFARITGDSTKNNASVMYSSTIHGDELGGYVLMLRLINYLLANYSNTYIKTLIDNLDIWINPLANPDGTYFGGDNDVWASTRGNANGVDLNRNFKDPVRGENPDGEEYQPETYVVRKIMDQDTFILSANIHAGSEVVNYPWDCMPELHPENEMFERIAKEYADTVQEYGRSGYFTSVTTTGYTNGYEWYPVFGGRQDYITFFINGHELTLEIDNTKRTPENQLNNLWNYNYRSLLNFLVNAITDRSKGWDKWVWPVYTEVGTKDINASVEIFPNPANRFLHIKFSDNSAKVVITDLNGRTIIMRKISENKTIDVSDLKTGVYNLQIITSVKSYNKLFIKQ